MPRCAVFLRAINVTGRFVTMAELQAAVAGLGYGGVQTFINTGNLVLDSAGLAPEALAADLDTRLPERLGFVAEAFVRPVSAVATLAQQAQALLDAWPGATEANVIFLPAPLNATQLAVLATLGGEDDRLLHDPATHGAHLFWLCRTRQSESKVSNTLLERKLKLRCTLRRHSMLQKMAQTLAL